MRPHALWSEIIPPGMTRVTILNDSRPSADPIWRELLAKPPTFETIKTWIGGGYVEMVSVRNQRGEVTAQVFCDEDGERSDAKLWPNPHAHYALGEDVNIYQAWGPYVVLQGVLYTDTSEDWDKA